MYSIYQLILNKFIKYSITPIVILHTLLIMILFVMTNYQAKEVKSELENTYILTFDKISEKIANNIELRFEQASLSVKQIQSLAEEIFSNPQNYISSNLTLHKYKNTFRDNKDSLSSIFTTGVNNLSSEDLKNLQLLYLISPIIRSVMNSNKDLINSAWINIDKKYTLTHPYIDINNSIPSVNLSKYKFNSDKPIYSFNKDSLFVNMYFEDTVKSGEIGAFLSTIYVHNKLIGIATLHLSIDLLAKSLQNLQLPYNSYAMVLDRENRLLASTDENRSFNDFNITSFYENYSNNIKNLNSDLYKLEDSVLYSDEDKIIFTKHIKNSDFRVIIYTDRISLFKKFEVVFENLREVGYIAGVLFLLFFVLSLSVTIRVIKNIANKIAIPIGEVVRFSNQLGVNEHLSIKSTNIKEFNALIKRLTSVNIKLCDILIKDNLTGLYNRRKLLIDIDKNKKQALIVANIIHFKHLNNVYGSEAGDFILKEVVRVFEKLLCKDCSLYRIGGDEFAILMPFSLNKKDLILFYDRKEVVVLIDNIVNSFTKHIINYDGFEIVVDFYKGVGFSDDNKIDLISKADIALSESKRKKVHYSMYSEDLKTIELFEQNLFWCKKLKDSLEDDKVVAYFQPILNLKTNKVEKFEALVRLIDGDNVVSPAQFLESAKNIGKLNDITRLMVEKVFKTALVHRNYQFSINISFSDFEDKDMIEFIRNMLDRYKIEPQRIVFEILETEAISDDNMALDFIAHLKEIGFQIAIDDFGSSHSNFAHILKIETDYIKIDGAFIKNINNDENSFKIAKTIIGFSKLLDTKTVAEYVSNEHILKKVKDMGVDFAQGFHISKPMSREDLDIFLATTIKD